MVAEKASTKIHIPISCNQQNPDGSFIDVAEVVGLDLSGDGRFIWLHANADNEIDLLTSQYEFLQLYHNKGGQFEYSSLRKLPGNASKFTISDYDLDGDIDVYISARNGNVLLVNRDEGYEFVDPASVGLPTRGLHPNWVDYDNDGLPDLHVIPGGLYRQQPDGTFEAMQLLSENSFQIGTNKGFLSTFALPSGS